MINKHQKVKIITDSYLLHSEVISQYHEHFRTLTRDILQHIHDYICNCLHSCIILNLLVD